MTLVPSEVGGFLKRALLFLAVAVCVFAIVVVFWTRARRHTYQVSYRLRAPAGGVTEQELARTLAVLSARLKTLRREFKLGPSSVSLVPPDGVRVELSTGDDPTAPLAWLTMQGKAEFRLLHPQDDVLERSGPEAVPAGCEVKTYTERHYVLTRLGDLKPLPTRYALLREPSLVVCEFQAVSFATKGASRSVVLTLRFKDDDGRAFAAFTALHAGRRMAMLVDGEMFFPAKQIESAITEGAVQVQGFFYIPPVRRLAEMLDSGSLPYPLEKSAETPAGAERARAAAKEVAE